MNVYLSFLASYEKQFAVGRCLKASPLIAISRVLEAPDIGLHHSAVPNIWNVIFPCNADETMFLSFNAMQLSDHIHMRFKRLYYVHTAKINDFYLPSELTHNPSIANDLHTGHILIVHSLDRKGLPFLAVIDSAKLLASSNDCIAFSSDL